MARALLEKVGNGSGLKPKEAMMIPDFKPYELCALSDEELNALFAYIRKQLPEAPMSSPESRKAIDLLEAIRIEFKRRIAKKFGWASPAS
jgi:hypothetical protein